MKFLVIQTAFLGDAILASTVPEKLHSFHPTSSIDLLVRKGNETVFEGHPYLNQVLALDKKKNKWMNILSMAASVRRNKYDVVINLHRFGSSGFITFLSGAKEKIGFDKNFFSFCYTQKMEHAIGNGTHEIERNHRLIAHLTDAKPALPKLYPAQKDNDAVKKYISGNYVCIAPASIWYTKQFPKEKWIELANLLNTNIFLIGASGDHALCEEIKSISVSKVITNLAGKLSILETAALMKNAQMNYVNDSAPMHIASSVNASTTAIFCSTVPAFGFGPLAENSKIIETKEKLDCRPCGLHGYMQCPKGNFKCATSIEIKDIL